MTHYSYRKYSDETWARIRDDYLAGMTAEQVCLRYDVGVRTFWDRALRDGWRRCDQSDSEPDEMSRLAVFDDYEPEHLEELARLRLTAATARGDAASAIRWRRLYEFWSTEASKIREWQAESAAFTEEIRRRKAESAQSAQ